MAGSREAMAAREMVEGREVGTVAVVAPGRAGDGDSLEVKGATAELDSGLGSGSAVENAGVAASAAGARAMAARAVASEETVAAVVAMGLAGVEASCAARGPRCADEL